MEHFSEKEKYDLKNSSKKLTLAEPPFSWEEVYDALESMLEKRTTMGNKVKKFERERLQKLKTKTPGQKNVSDSFYKYN